jgi:hypothetical protein
MGQFPIIRRRRGSVTLQKLVGKSFQMNKSVGKFLAPLTRRRRSQGLSGVAPAPARYPLRYRDIDPHWSMYFNKREIQGKYERDSGILSQRSVKVRHKEKLRFQTANLSSRNPPIKECEIGDNY